MSANDFLQKMVKTIKEWHASLLNISQTLFKAYLLLILLFSNTSLGVGWVFSLKCHVRKIHLCLELFKQKSSRDVYFGLKETLKNNPTLWKWERRKELKTTLCKKASKQKL